MNREELERMFDEQDLIYSSQQRIEIKNFIFDELIPNVLSSMLVYEWTWINDIIEKRKYTNRLIKQKAKAFYNITL